MAPAAPSQTHAPLPETLRALLREHAITYRALAARTQLIDRHGNGLSYSHIANLASGRDTPSRHALELLARAFELPVSYFAEYRLAEPAARSPAGRSRASGTACRSPRAPDSPSRAPPGTQPPALEIPHRVRARQPITQRIAADLARREERHERPHRPPIRTPARGAQRLTIQPLLIAHQHQRPVRRDDRPSPRGTLLVIGTHSATLHAARQPVIGTKPYPSGSDNEYYQNPQPRLQSMGKGRAVAGGPGAHASC
jgi:transcriptional regulator with XRE-family HTH domain